MTIKTILVPTDFSICAAQALERAAEIAEKFGARLVLMHVVSIPSGVTAGANIDPGDHRRVSVGEYTRQTSLDALGRVAEPYKSLGLMIDVRVDIGEIVPTIISNAKRESVISWFWARMGVRGSHE